MKNILICISFLIASCNLPEEKEESATINDPDTTAVIQTNDDYTASADQDVKVIPVTKNIKRPSGIYQAVLPFSEHVSMEQTIAFYSNNTYQLQERFDAGKKDSVVITEGNWSPSDGYIWLYKDQVVRGRYQWKEDTLQYVSPGLKKDFSMAALRDVLETPEWKQKKNEGLLIYGTGSEPFWSIGVSNQDSLTFLLSDWSLPVNLKIDSVIANQDGKFYLAHNDSVQLKLTIMPYFCTDGINDFVYRNKLKVQYNNQVYRACGIVYQN